MSEYTEWTVHILAIGFAIQGAALVILHFRLRTIEEEADKFGAQSRERIFWEQDAVEWKTGCQNDTPAQEENE